MADSQPKEDKMTDLSPKLQSLSISASHSALPLPKPRAKSYQAVNISPSPQPEIVLPLDSASNSGSSSSHKATPKVSYRPSTVLTYDAILLTFPSGYTQWYDLHSLALHKSREMRTEITHRIAYLQSLKCARQSEIDYRQREFIESASGVPEAYFQNWQLWVTYLGGVDKFVEAAKQHSGWLLLLETEYDKIAPAWEDFWAAHHDLEKATASAIIGDSDSDDSGPDAREEALTESTDPENAAEATKVNDKALSKGVLAKDPAFGPITQQLSEHNRKKAYLHDRILESNGSMEMRAFWGEGEPEWVDWGFGI